LAKQRGSIILRVIIHTQRASFLFARPGHLVIENMLDICSSGGDSHSGCKGLAAELVSNFMTLK
jgi:hypothetical protein